MDNKEMNVNISQVSIRDADGNKNNPVQVPDSSPGRVNDFPPFNRSVGAGTAGGLRPKPAGNGSYKNRHDQQTGGLRPKPAGNGSYKNRHDKQTGFIATVNPPSAADSYQSKYIENIADFLDPAEVRYFLFQGHENEHFAVNYLNPDIGATPQDNDNQNSFGLQLPAAAPFPSVLDTKVCCIFCHQNLSYESTAFQERSCGHYFHIECYHAQPPTIQEIHIKNRECNFCVLERP